VEPQLLLSSSPRVDHRCHHVAVPDQATSNATSAWHGPTYANPSYTGPCTGSCNPTAANGTPTGNNGNPTTNMGRTGLNGFGPGGLFVMAAPCVGALRIVPDYMS